MFFGIVLTLPPPPGKPIYMLAPMQLKGEE